MSLIHKYYYYCNIILVCYSVVIWCTDCVKAGYVVELDYKLHSQLVQLLQHTHFLVAAYFLIREGAFVWDSSDDTAIQQRRTNWNWSYTQLLRWWLSSQIDWVTLSLAHCLSPLMYGLLRTGINDINTLLLCMHVITFTLHLSWGWFPFPIPRTCWRIRST
jgi:hypothetical protein